MESTTENNLLSLKWNGFTDNIISSLNISLDHQDFVDVTLVCEGGSIKAHRLILSASSSFFQRVLKENICPHPVIVLKGITLSELEPLLMFIYHGEARTFQENVPRLLEAAHFLEIRGLTSEYGQGSSDFKIPKENLDGFDEINDSHQTGVHSTTQEVNEFFLNVETFNPFVRRNEFQSGTESECETNGSERTDMVIKQEPLEEEESNTQNLKDLCNRTPTSPITTKCVSHSDQNDTCQAGLKLSIQEKMVLQQQKKLAFYEPRPCPKCHRVYRDAATLRNHLASMHEILRHRVVCSCGKLFQTKYDHHTHRKRDHKGGGDDNRKNVTKWEGYKILNI